MQFPNGNQETYIKTRKTTNSTFQDFLENKATLGCTLGSMFRNVIFKHGIPEKMKNLETSTQEVSFRGDTFRSIIHLNKGKAHYEPQCDAIYRITNIGIWQSLSEIERNIQNAQVYLDLYLFFDEKYQQLLLKSYRLFRLSEKSLVSSLSKIEDENKKIRIIQTLEKLNSVYSENQIIVNKKKYKRLPIKYKIMYYLYKKLYKKLDKAGFLILE